MGSSSFAPLAGVLLALGSAPVAFGMPTAEAQADRGSLHVMTSIVVGPGHVDFRGTWRDPTLSCDEFRTIRVSSTIRYTVRSRIVRTVPRTRAGAVRNCGTVPRFGIRVRARSTHPRPEGRHPHLGLSCANGRWIPGDYTFIVRTTHRNSQLASRVAIRWKNETPCERENARRAVLRAG
jgi:hypothetical protein